MSEAAVDEEMSSEMSEEKRKAKSLRRWSVNIRRVVLVLAVLEQAATHLAQIAFVGATVVLLGGYATRLKLYDFVLISALLLSEGVRVFLASLNAEYTRAIGGAFAGNSGPGLCVLPWFIYWGLCSTDTTTGKRNLTMTIFQALQMGSAAVTFAFSLYRLKSGNYKPALMSSPSDAGEVANFVYGIRLFYILTLVESSVFLVVKAVGWELLALLLAVGKRENGEVLFAFALKIYGLFLNGGFGKASATNYLTFIINFILENQTRAWESVEALVEALEGFLWHEEAEITESIQCLIRLTAPGQPPRIRDCANQILARVALRDFLFPVSEFGRIPLEVVDIDVIKFLDHIVTDAPLGFLPVEAVSKQASKFLMRSIYEGNDNIKAQAALTFLNWWSIPDVYRNYGFDPADIFYRLYIDRRQRVSDGVAINLEAALEYEAIAEPIRTAFSQALKTPARSDVMNKLLSRVDFSKLKKKQSTINLSGIVAEVIGAKSELDDIICIDAFGNIAYNGVKREAVVGLVAAWIWFMDESTFEKAISNLTKEELGMLKENTTIYRAILNKVPAFSI